MLAVGLTRFGAGWHFYEGKSCKRLLEGGFWPTASCEIIHKPVAAPSGGSNLDVTMTEAAAPTTIPVGYDSKIEGNVIHTKLDAAINWMRKNSLWPMPMGLACCAIE